MAYFENDCVLNRLKSYQYELFLLCCIGESIKDYDGHSSLEDINEQVNDYKAFIAHQRRDDKTDHRKEIRENLVKLNEAEAKRYFNFLSKYLAEGKEHFTKMFNQVEDLYNYAQFSHPKGIDFIRSLEIHESIEDYSAAFDYFFDEFSSYLNNWRSFVASIEDEYKLELNAYAENESKKVGERNCNQKILWKGELKEFAELIDQLQEKSWIIINDRELKPTVESICNLFDFSATKKKDDSNTVASLNQYLKETERAEKIYTKRYTKKFSSILPNSNEKVVTK